MCHQFSAIPQEDYHLGLPRPGQWQELINTDAAVYGGSGVGNLGTITAHQIPHHAQPASTRLRVPPLGSLWLRPRSPE
ncbi:MAG: alpha amylase C-terminal domain-containing protein [Marmoricola sp.]